MEKMLLSRTEHLPVFIQLRQRKNEHHDQF